MSVTTTYDIDGFIVAQDGNLRINAEFRIKDGTVYITRASGERETLVTIPAVHPAAIRHYGEDR